jgi:hypothetical protein
MKRIICFCLCIVVVLSLLGCRKREENREEHKVGRLEKATQLEVKWDKLTDVVRNNAEMQKEVNEVLKRDMNEDISPFSEEALKRIYGMLSNPEAKSSSAKDALEIFIELKANEVIRESLLHKNRDVVILACDALIDQAERGTKDANALPYLIYVLSQGKRLQEGSEDASAHIIMKRKLIDAIHHITDIDMKPSEINEDSPEQVEQVLSMAKAWANQKGIKLFNE